MKEGCEIGQEFQNLSVEGLEVAAFTIPTESPESDGTIEWNSTTLVLVEIKAAGITGTGYTYATASTADFIERSLKSLVIGKNPFHIPEITDWLIRQIRNNGTCGIGMMAVSAVDNALWDLKGKLQGLPLALLLGMAKKQMLIYGSGGFTSYSGKQLEQQLGGWADKGIRYVKMKIGREPEKDPARVKIAQNAIESKAGLFVDANGAYSAKQALEKAAAFSESGVSWFEEPVPSSDLSGLHFIRNHAPAGMNITAGEYGFNLPYFQKMLSAGTVDVLQADATRCGGISGFLKAGYLCEAFQIPFSSHCAPSLHLHAALSLPSFFIAEYFFDHVRIENMLFEGAPAPEDGFLKPDLIKPGLGLRFLPKEAAKFKI